MTKAGWAKMQGLMVCALPSPRSCPAWAERRPVPWGQLLGSPLLARRRCEGWCKDALPLHLMSGMQEKQGIEEACYLVGDCQAWAGS